MQSVAAKLQKQLTASGQLASASESSSDTNTDDASDDDSGSDEEMEPPPLLILQPRSSEPVGAFEYDVVKVVWSQPNFSVMGPAIRSAMGKYWDLIKPVRDSWKAANADTQVAEVKGKMEEVNRFKAIASEKRKLLDHAFQVTTEHGHPHIVET